MKFGEMVMITEGYQKDTIGYISAIPNKSVGRNEYVISTKEYPCGQWLTEKQFYVIPFDNNSYKDITSTRNVYMEYYQYLPDNIDPFLYFTEMAEIAPDYNRSHNIKNGFRVWMEPNEGPIPHIHIVFKDKKRAYIKLGAPEYLNGHENKSYHLNSIDCKNLQRFFESTIIQIDSNGEEIEKLATDGADNLGRGRRAQSYPGVQRCLYRPGPDYQ